MISAPSVLAAENQALDGLSGLLHRLADVYGVVVSHGWVPDPDIALWDDRVRVVTLLPDLPTEDEVAVLIEVWTDLAIGPHATRWAEPRPLRLHLVLDRD